MSSEMEVKYQLYGDLAAQLFHKVFHKAASEGKVLRMVDKYFETYRGALRIRTTDDGVSITFKGKPEMDENGVKTRQELEFPISHNQEDFRALFEALGMRQTVTVTKTRYSLLLAGMEFSYDWIDELGKAYLEIEAKEAMTPEDFKERVQVTTDTWGLPLIPEKKSYEELVRDKVHYGIG